MNQNQERALAALIESDTQSEAAEKCGLSVRTLRGYLSDPAFAAELSRQQRQIVSDASRQIQTRLLDAVKTIHSIMTAEKMPPGANVRIIAARALLEFGLRYTEAIEVLPLLADLRDKVKRLEELNQSENTSNSTSAKGYTGLF